MGVHDLGWSNSRSPRADGQESVIAMMGMPAPNQFDVKFTLLGVPVRINPFFWVVSAAIGWQNRDGFGILVWIGCVFVSILVHEYGHALTGRTLSGLRPTIALYMLGGLCGFDRETRSPIKRIATLLMGPGAGFLLAAVVAGLGISVLGYIDFGPFYWKWHDAPKWNTALLTQAYYELLWINLLWGLVNLVPIYPLDGGQIAGVLLTTRNKNEGMKWTYILSMVTAAVVAYLLFTRKQEVNAAFVGFLGLNNMQLYQSARYQATQGSEPEDDDDWWRK